MKAVSVLALLGLVVATAHAFAPSPAFARVPRSQLYSTEPEDEEEGGLDLNLEEMFDMFDAADGGEEFDKAMEKVKKAEN
mmetsp:Transcript_117267/g.339024  ORF Transcript_117267/g.339024 Transcript_117267/m.339024 type:complete len:80 (-) Transcript_117267:153-392(-)